MKIFLAGATGAVGRLLLPRLINAGHRVVGMSRTASKRQQIEDMGGTACIVDVLDRDGLMAVLESIRPDVVIHQLTDLSRRDFAANSHLRIEGTRNLVDAALSAGVERMIAQSISWIYVPGDVPAHEDDPLDLKAAPPRGSTVTAVDTLEQCVAEMPVGIVLRYGLFYGPGTWYSRDGLTTEQMRSGEITATDAITSFIHVADAAEAAHMALDWDAGAVNIVDDEPAVGTEWLPFYAHLVGAPPPPVKSGRQGWERGASNTKARQLGWEPAYPDWRESFKSVLG